MLHRALLLLIVSATTLHSQAPEADSFKFRDGRGHTSSVTLEESNATIAMTWPESADRMWDTALLGVAATVDAEVAAPFVELTAGGRSDRQYFRSGETGPRWLNLSFLRGVTSGGSRVSVRGEGVRIAAGAAPLRLFANRLD